ncbi:MAG: zinc ribbon domain-containing protein [Candidatus Aminicenantaceae bacterium]
MDIDFESLIELQEIDKKISNISLSIEKIPDQINEIERQKESSRKILTEAKEKLALNQKKRRELEATSQDIKEKVSKYKLQLNKVKTNKEYSSLLKEIEDAEEEVDSLEEKIINEMLIADSIEEEIRTADKNFQEDNKECIKQKESLLQEKEELNKKIEGLTESREKLASKIPSKEYNLYQKLHKNKNGIALSPVNNEFCSMCHMRIRPQVINELKAQNEIIVCENCGRILYIPKKEA